MTLAPRVRVSTRRARLLLHLVAGLQSLEHAARARDYFAAGGKSAGDFDVGFAGDAGRDFDELHLVVLAEDIDTFLLLGLFANRSRRAAREARTRRRRRRGLFNNRLKRNGDHVVLRLGRDRSSRAHARTEFSAYVIA